MEGRESELSFFDQWLAILTIGSSENSPENRHSHYDLGVHHVLFVGFGSHEYLPSQYG